MKSSSYYYGKRNGTRRRNRLALITFLCILLVIITATLTSCDSTRGRDLPSPNYSPYTQILITQDGDELTAHTTADSYYWYDWDAHEKRIDNGMSNENSLRQPNEWTTEPMVIWTKKCRVRVGCMRNGNVNWSNIIKVK